jgi:hypothetical protein
MCSSPGAYKTVHRGAGSVQRLDIRGIGLQHVVRIFSVESPSFNRCFRINLHIAMKAGIAVAIG